MKKSFFMSILFSMLALTYTNAQPDNNTAMPTQDSIATKALTDTIPPKRIRINGFRVQVYYGGNNQKAKQEARKMAERVKIWFEELPVYTSFSSPHWICRVGDFQTREEAMEVLQAMRESGRFPRAIIVKSKINITEDELRREEPDSCARRDTTAYCTYSGTIG
jgi:diaminopimelate epimerase